MVWDNNLILFDLLQKERLEKDKGDVITSKSSISSKRPPRLFEIVASLTEDEFDLFEDLPYNLKSRFLKIEDNELEARLTDSLTGLYGHGAREKDLVSFIDFAYRHNQPLSYLALDLDKFKSINDTYGHPVGDKVLNGVSKVILENIRDEDNAYRQGGEELSLLLPATDIETAKLVAEKLRGIIENEVLIIKKRISAEELKYEFEVIVGKSQVDKYRNSDLIERYVTTSIGVSTYLPQNGIENKTQMRENIETLLNTADIALYKAKNTGRNRVEVYIQ